METAVRMSSRMKNPVYPLRDLRYSSVPNRRPTMSFSPAFATQEWEELRTAHADLSAVDLEFREQASADPVLLNRATFARLDAEHPLLTFRLQSWPTFIARSRA